MKKRIISSILTVIMLMTMLPTAALAAAAPPQIPAEQLSMYPKAAMIQPPAMRAHPLKQLVRHLRRQLTVVPSICFQT